MKTTAMILFALTCQAPAMAQLAADEEIARVREALGWDQVVRCTGAVMVRGAAQMRGTLATQTEVFDGRGRRLQTFEGPLPMSGGFDGETEWSVDWTGVPRRLELGERVAAQLAAGFLNGSWTASGGLLEFRDARQEGDEILLDFAHAGGQYAGQVRIDAETHLPRVASWSSGTSGSESVWTFSDYFDTDGYRFPKRITLTQSGFEQSLDTQEVHWIDEVDDALFAPRLARPADTRFDAAIPAELEVKRVPSGHVLVRPTIDGKDLGWFIFDTGAGINCIAEHVAAELAEGPFGTIRARGVGGTVTSRFWRADRLQVGPVTVEDPIFMGLDLEFLSAPFGVEVAGILGYEFIARCAIEFDVSGPSIALFDPEKYKMPSSGRWEEILLYQRQPCVRARLEGREGVFVLDTGAGGDTLMVHYPAAKELDLIKGRAVTAGSSSGGIGGRVGVLAGELASFELAGHDFGKIQAQFATEAGGAFADACTMGNIGGKLIEPFLLVLDYSHRRVGFVLK